jgi:hypothetical protein
MKFHDSTATSIKWENSSIRKFLNSRDLFLKEFASFEMDMIPLMKNQYISISQSSENLIYNEEILDCTNNYKSAFKETSEDLVFLVSLKELVKYLRDNRFDFRPVSSDTNIAQTYWTRDISTKAIMPTKFTPKAVRSVFIDGSIRQLTQNVIGGVRPAMYLHRTNPNGGSGTLQDPYFF